MRYFKFMMISICCALSLAGCFWKKGKVVDREISIESDMSSPVYLQPVLASQRVVYLKSNQNIPITQLLEADGYRMTSNLSRAYFQVKINIVKTGNVSAKQLSSMLNTDYGSPLVQEQVMQDATVTMNTSVMVADVQLSERSQKGWSHYKDRIICHAQKENLKFSDVEPQLRECVAKSIVKLF